MSNEIKYSSTEIDQIFMVRVYQAVQFEKKQETYFHSVDIGNGNYAKKITMLKDLSAIRIDGKKDSIIVPFTNISQILLMSNSRKESLDEAKESRDTKSGVRNAEIPRPSKPKGAL